ncbi:LutC/YkgG family protein [Pluralibacter gergoviae]|uniref:Lactate utilization protein C n=1 Tax=Pluralibacter gergoviae TaxID=61647 RepID=A0AAW8HSJ7_PLUGE|nr:lactate utilization protein C [Pluralibacter gergoviae]AVR05553.1 lactate utilization protein C [Pluralibacter gergoviae]KMK04771.1 lactate utilization protein B/C [Pluralibacter gergoviae]KMK25929.1 lactate utilization protein B/C [Pluralibacter gergoviae]MDQ2311442.1 lactate utilization protein C [Pluralibacter gergoviae]SUB69929.1 Lactate utilization protein C [Pluralibacter gergoviae]
MNDNRSAFLTSVARALGREPRREPAPRPEPVNDYPQTRLSELSLQQRCDAFIDFASSVMQMRCELAPAAQAADAALHLCECYGGQPVIVSGDARLAELGITARLRDACGAAVWDPARGEENLALAARAKIGVTFAEYGLTESGGVVLFSGPERGRALSLLPETSLFVLKKSTILPRVAQLASRLHQMAQAGERMPSCINLIGGPSSTADIELIKVIGVHGPVNAACLIVEDR